MFFRDDWGFLRSQSAQLRQFRKFGDIGSLWDLLEPSQVTLNQGLSSQCAQLHASPAYKLCANSTFLSPFCLNVSSMTSASKAAPCPNLSSYNMTSRP
jgi:hypothetical protein